MNKSNKFSPEVRERAVRVVQEHRGEYPSLWAAVESIAPKIGCVPQTLLDRRLVPRPLPPLAWSSESHDRIRRPLLSSRATAFATMTIETSTASPCLSIAPALNTKRLRPFEFMGSTDASDIQSFGI